MARTQKQKKLKKVNSLYFYESFKLFNNQRGRH